MNKEGMDEDNGDLTAFLDCVKRFINILIHRPNQEDTVNVVPFKNLQTRNRFLTVIMIDPNKKRVIFSVEDLFHIVDCRSKITACDFRHDDADGF